MAILPTPPRHIALRIRSVRPPDQNHFLSIFCRAPPQTPPSTDEKRKVRKWFCRSGSLQSLQNGSLNKFIAYAIPLAVFPFPCELWCYDCGNLKVRSLTRNTSHWLAYTSPIPARCSRDLLALITVLCELYRKKKDCTKRTSKSYCAFPTYPMRAQTKLP